ncbi:MAG: DUF1501 domain-containing protein [Pirellulales bacterium]|nr:DUF1501 domain-containing protein [Pirellulales bacterium]
MVKPLHHKAKAKRVIYLCQAGGPSHLETFDYKPKLAEMHGKPMPESYTKGQPIAQLQGKALKCFGPQRTFKKYGKSGQTISDVFPHISKLADDMCIVNSAQTNQINHDPAHTFINTGTQISGRPSMGSWITYGLGQESNSLPGFVVLTSVGGGQSQPIAARQWHSGFLPSRFQGVHFHSKGDPVLYVNRPAGVSKEQQGDVVSAINELNKIREGVSHDPEITTRIAQYELAARMQASVPELMDLTDESKATFDLYGTKGGDGSFASNCLLARRLAERGVRFIHLYHRGWDHHGGVKAGVAKTAGLVDRGTAALITDLKQRGMLEDTLVIWGGEFGRTPMAQGSGRDHHIKGFTMWMAGGGIKGGITYGATDELGYNAVENVFHIRDFHATMLHLLGIDHQRLSVRHQGLDFRLTGVEEAHVVKDILA